MEKQIPMLFKADSTHLKLFINLAELQYFIWIDKLYLHDHLTNNDRAFTFLVKKNFFWLTIRFVNGKTNSYAFYG